MDSRSCRGSGCGTLLVAAPYWDAAELYTYTPPGGVSRGTTIPVSLGGTFTLTTPLTTVGDGQDCSAFTTQATCPSTCHWDPSVARCVFPVIQGSSCLDEAYSTQATCPSWCHWSALSNTCNDVVDGNALRGELAAQVLAGNLPAPDTGSPACRANLSQAECIAHPDCAWSESGAACMNNPRLYYMLHFPGRVSIRDIHGSSVTWSLEGYCAYHDSTTLNGGLFSTPIAFSVQPDFSENLPGGAARCGWGLGQSEDGSTSGNTFDIYSELVTHELMETLTNPFHTGWANAPTCGSEEVSDICASYNWMIPRTKFDTGRTYRNYWAVQSFYLPLDPLNIGTAQAFCGVEGAVPEGFTPVNAPVDACSGQPDGTACDDGNACTQSDTCQSGTCTGSDPVTCTISGQCHVAGTCNPSTGTCSNPAATDGTACNDGNACTQSDTCQGGACTGSTPVTCTASDQCHIAGTCNPSTGTCSNPAATDGTACNDGNTCTQTDTCQSGACRGTNDSWSGVLQPVNPDGSSIFKLGNTIPVKFKLTGACAGNPNLAAHISVAKVSNSTVGDYLEATSTSTSAAGTGNTFRYDASTDQYVYNLATKPLSAGTWQIAIDLGDGSGNRLAPLISLKK